MSFKIKPKNFNNGIRWGKGNPRPCDECGALTNFYQHDFTIECSDGLHYFSITKCKKCHDKEERFEEWQNKHENTDSTICPWCEYEFEDYEDGYEPEDDEECECPNCGKTFIRTVECKYSYTTFKPEEAFEDDEE